MDGVDLAVVEEGGLIDPSATDPRARLGLEPLQLADAQWGADCERDPTVALPFESRLDELVGAFDEKLQSENLADSVGVLGVEALAWYDSERLGNGPAIYIRERGVLRVFKEVFGLVVGEEKTSAPVRFSVRQALELSCALLFDHELFHHLVERAAEMLERAYPELSRGTAEIYVDYRQNAFSGPADLVQPREEALATAFMIRRASERMLEAGASQRLLKKVRDRLQDWIQSQMSAPYSTGLGYAGSGFQSGLDHLAAELMEGSRRKEPIAMAGLVIDVGMQRVRASDPATFYLEGI